MLRVKVKIPFLGETDIEVEANALLARYKEKRNETLIIPVDVQYIAEEVLGYSIDWEPDTQLNNLAYIDPNRRIICFNSNRSEFFDRRGGFEFTAAHEIGHYVLNHFEDVDDQLSLALPVEPDHFLYPEGQPKPKYKQHEFQANYFAGCLLMPKQIILSKAQQYDLLSWKGKNGIYDFAEYFCVSPSAMTRRLENLKLIYVENRKLYRSKEEACGQSQML